MASSSAIKKLVQNSAILKRGAEAARQEIFGHLPQLNIQSGHSKAKVSFTGPYLARYYPESINKYARKVRRTFGIELGIQYIANLTRPLAPYVHATRYTMGGRQTKRNTTESSWRKDGERERVHLRRDLDHVPRGNKLCSMH
jgi:hypothetical protein